VKKFLIGKQRSRTSPRLAWRIILQNDFKNSEAKRIKAENDFKNSETKRIIVEIVVPMTAFQMN
jgi:hypothetical protein